MVSIQRKKEWNSTICLDFFCFHKFWRSQLSRKIVFIVQYQLWKYRHRNFIGWSEQLKFIIHFIFIFHVQFFWEIIFCCPATDIIRFKLLCSYFCCKYVKSIPRKCIRNLEDATNVNKFMLRYSHRVISAKISAIRYQFGQLLNLEANFSFLFLYTFIFLFTLFDEDCNISNSSCWPIVLRSRKFLLLKILDLTEIYSNWPEQSQKILTVTSWKPAKNGVRGEVPFYSPRGR